MTIGIYCLLTVSLAFLLGHRIINMSNIVLVSGANQGIGYEIAKQLSQMPDYHVFLGSRNLDKGKTAAAQIEEAGGSIQAIQLDVTDRKSLSAARQYIETKFERLDVLVSV
jgi:NADP-dependent 3-hydroxy acid dehydrogenase YdfG